MDVFNEMKGRGGWRREKGRWMREERAFISMTSLAFLPVSDRNRTGDNYKL